MKKDHSIIPIATLLFVMVASPLTAQILSNGTGGGDWSQTTTWEGGIVPTTHPFIVRPGDTVTVNAGVTYSHTFTNTSEILGTLDIGTGASIRVARIPSSATAAAGIVNVNGGSFTASRFLMNGTVNTLTVNVGPGGVFTQTDTGLTAPGALFNVIGGQARVMASTIQGVITINGGTFELTNGYASFSTQPIWTGGALVANGGNPGASDSYRFINAWKSNAANLLDLSSKTAKQTLTFGPVNTAMTVNATQGRILFHVYSAVDHDSDRLAVGGTLGSTLSLSSGVEVTVEDLTLGGTVNDYMGRTYQLFSVPSGVYTNLTPTLANSVWTIGGEDYAVVWTNNLAVDGTLTVADLNSLSAPPPKPAVSIAPSVTPNQLRISFASANNVTYRLKSNTVTPRLTDAGWIDASDPLTGNGSPQFFDAPAPTEGPIFYLVSYE